MHAGGGMRSGGFSGGFSGPRSSPAFRPGISLSRGFATSPRTGNHYPGTRPTFYSRNGSYSNRSHGNNYRRNNYGYPIFLNNGYGYPLYDDFIGNDADLFWGDYNPNLTTNSGQPPSGASQPSYDQAESQPYPQQAWQPPYTTAPPAYGTRNDNNPAPEDTTTLVFKDGRPPEQIHNYALSRTAIYITGPRIREIALDDLDLAATQRANQDSGTPFQLP